MDRMTENEFRNKVTWTTFILSYLVVMIHTYNIDLFMEGEISGNLASAVNWAESLVSLAAPTAAVPGFFVISSYLFYRDITWKKIPEKMIRRVRSVLIPYAAWNALYYLLFLAASRIPGLAPMTGRDTVVFSLENLADAIMNYSYNPVLWYLQQLIILIAISPAVYALLSNAWTGLCAIIIMLYFLHIGTVTPILNLDALLYYSVGAFLAMHGKRIPEIRDTTKPAGRLLKLLAAACGFLLCIFCFKTAHRYGYVLATISYGLLVPASVWTLLPSGGLPIAGRWMRDSFFLYAFHFLVVRTLNKAGAGIFPHTPLTALLFYILVPIVTVVLAFILAGFLKKRIPPLWRILSGGR